MVSGSRRSLWEEGGGERETEGGGDGWRKGERWRF